MRRALAVAALLASCTSARPVVSAPAPTPAVSAPLPPPSLTLFITDELKGALEPCGCSQNMQGGLARTAELVAQARRSGTPVLYLDSGNTLFPATAVSAEQAPQLEEKARTVAAAMKAMGLAAWTQGPLDLARGEAFLAPLGLPAPMKSGSVQVLRAGPHQVGVVATADPASLPVLGAAARAQGAALVVALLEQPWELAVRASLEKDLPVDLIVATRPKSELAADKPRLGGGAVRVVQPTSRGRGVVRVDVFFRDGPRVEWLRGAAEQERELSALASRVELLREQVNDPTAEPALRELRKAKLEELIARRDEFAAQAPPAPANKTSALVRVVPIESTLASNAQVQALVEGYDRTVDALNLSLAKKSGHDCAAPTAAEPGFVGSAACVECHRAESQVWKETRHARATLSLAEKHKAHHLDCIGCHVTGWKQTGGVCRVDKVSGREGVGCESCHGPGSAHAATPRLKHLDTPDAQTCVACHDAENSPHFAFERFITRIVVPGHGKPLPDAGTTP
jgi:hypothetical protein